MTDQKNILICPLEWGLGHAARIIPLARHFREMNNNVIIASGAEHLSLCRAEIPGITCINFPGFKPGYSRSLPQYISLFFKIPLLFYHSVTEHFRVRKIIEAFNIDILISDNRFGLWNRKVVCVYITHMPLIPLPGPLRFLEPVGVFIHRMIIKRYTYCFIPDLPGDLNLTGRLSHGIKLPRNVKYIGILSRFTYYQESISEKLLRNIHNTVILSGPEPQREILKQKLIAIFRDKEPQTVILEGKPDDRGEIKRDGNIIFYNHLPAPRMKELLVGSEGIISRSGYTTIMDLVSLNCMALIIPTPGQTEQEYLAEYLSEKGWFKTLKQDLITKDLSFPPAKTVMNAEIIKQSSILLADTLKELLKK